MSGCKWRKPTSIDEVCHCCGSAMDRINTWMDKPANAWISLSTNLTLYQCPGCKTILIKER